MEHLQDTISVDVGGEAAEAASPQTGGRHGLEANAIGLVQSTIIGIATSAPGQSTAVTMAALLVASAYGAPATILIMMAPMLAIAYAYYRLNLIDPDCGATYVWAARIVPAVGFLVGWAMLAAYVLGTASDILPLGPSLLSLVGSSASSQWGEVLSATILGVGLTGLAVYGVRVSARFQLSIATIEYAILLGFCAIGLYAEFVWHPAGVVHPEWSWLSPTGVHGGGSFVGGALVAVYLFSGWDAPIYLNEETSGSNRNPGRAALLGVGILGVFYALLVFSLQGATAPGQITDHSESTLPFIAHQLVGSPWDKLMSLAIVLSVLGTTQGALISTARIACSMASDRVLPKPLATVSPRFRTPLIATIVFGAFAILMLWLYVFSSSVGSAFDTVISTAGLFAALFYAATGFTAAWFHRRAGLRSVRDFITLCILPGAAAAVLCWIAERTVAGFTGGELWTVAAIAFGGVAALVVARWWYRSPYFQKGPA